MTIGIQVIPHQCQRYSTVGDWIGFRTDVLQINVSDTGSEDYNFLIALHEMVEAYLCKRAGITMEQVDAWDLTHLDSEDPGSLSDCPYREQHEFATFVEKNMCWEMQLDWGKYEDTIANLFKENEGG